jgi:hypothetical protein
MATEFKRYNDTDHSSFYDPKRAWVNFLSRPVSPH